MAGRTALISQRHACRHHKRYWHREMVAGE
jgi:hypothetical protein